MTDPFVVRAVVILLGLIALVDLGICGALAWAEKPIGDLFVATLAGAVGAIGAVLSRTSSGPSPTE